MRFLLPLLLLAASDLPPPLRVKGCTPSIQGTAFSVSATDWHGVAHAADPVPTLTQNYGSGPPGSCSSASLRFQSVTGIFNYVYVDINTPPTYAGTQMCSGGSSNISWGFWAKCTANKTVDLATVDNANGTVYRGGCAVTAGTWTYCKSENQSWWLAENQFAIGNMPLLNGGTDRGALDCQFYAPRCVVAATISP